MKLTSTNYSDTAFSIATLILRLGLGILMIPHGYDKLQHFAERSQTFTNPFHLGSPLSLALVIFAEFFCAFLVVLGLFTRLACIPLIITMSVVVFYINHGHVFGKDELPALYLAGFLALVFIGPGKVSLDRLIGK
ncbi:MAG: DoxX family protein [Chitinophagaceae bacterium]